MSQDLTTLKQLIAGSYGSEDKKFGGHALDSGRARESLVEAGKQEVGFQEFLDLHSAYLADNGMPQSHIVKQLERVKDISFYFSFD